MNTLTDLTAEKAALSVKMCALLVVDSNGKIFGKNLQMERSAVRNCYLYRFAIRREIVGISILEA